MHLGKLYLLLGVLLFASCSDKMELDSDLSNVELHLDPAIKIADRGLPISSPYLDSLGLYLKPNGTEFFTQILESNRKYTFNTLLNEFELQGTPIYYPSSGNVDIIAYAPFKSGITSLYPIDVANQDNQKSIDFLYSNNLSNLNKQNGAVSLTFNHQLSKVVFNLRKSDGSTAGFESMRIDMLGFYDRADFNLANGSFSNKRLSSNPISIDIQRQGIIIPNESLPNRIFKFSMGDSEWQFTIPLEEIFEPGKVYEYTITIDSKDIKVQLSSIQTWVYNFFAPVVGNIESSPIEYAYIPAGTFQMGAPDTSTASNTHKPQHWVEISKSFYMSKQEITIGQYAEFLNALGVTYNNSSSISHPIDGTSTLLFYILVNKTPYYENNRWTFNAAQEHYPMMGVSWHGALAYAQWKGATLPTEAQWEYAYRAGTKTKFFTGNLSNVLMDYGSFYNNTGGNPIPVGQKLPNPWGLYDMAGNMMEWCLDGPNGSLILPYTPYSNELTPVVDPTGTVNKVGNAYIRGGNYGAGVQSASAYARNIASKDASTPLIGFRIVINP